MNNRFARKIAWFAAAGLLFAGNLSAGDDFRDYGRVVDVVPIYETVRVSYPEEVCRERRVYGHDHWRGSDAAVVAGAIVGGVIGTQFGKGSGNKAATVAGAVLGGALAHDARREYRHHGPRPHHKQLRCEIVDRIEERRELTGYDVTYRYKGELFHTRTGEHPGTRIPLRVTVSPARGGYGYR